MKIAYICSYNPFDKINRSGVPYSIYQQLLKYHDVVWIKPQYKGIFKLWGVLMRNIIAIGRRLGFSLHDRNVITAKIMSYYIQNELSKFEYDAIFSLNTFELVYVKTNKPIYLRIDAIYPSGINYYIFNMPKCFQNWANELEFKALEKITVVFTPSKWIINEVRKYYPQLDINKFYLLETGANIENNNIQYKIHTYSKDKNLNIIFVGFDVKRKGIDVAYATIVLLNEKYNIKTTLNIIGGKPDNKILHSRYVNYIGKLDKNIPEQYDAFYKAFENSDLFLFPTKAEYHGIVNCEAAAYALPIFSYNTGGVSSYVINDVNGYTLDLNKDAKDFAYLICSCITDGRMQKFSEGSRNLYETRFNWNVWGKKVNDIINKK